MSREVSEKNLGIQIWVAGEKSGLEIQIHFQLLSGGATAPTGHHHHSSISKKVNSNNQRFWAVTLHARHFYIMPFSPNKIPVIGTFFFMLLLKIQNLKYRKVKKFAQKLLT